MRLLKKCGVFLIAFLLVICFNLTVLAAIETTVSDDTVSIEFDFGADFANTEIGYEIVNPGMSLDSMAANDKEAILETFATVDQVTMGADGKATVVYKPKGVSGLYKVYAGRKPARHTGSFEFISKAEVIKIVTDIKGFSESETDKVKALFVKTNEEKLAPYELLGFDDTEVFELYEDSGVCTENVKKDIYSAIINKSDAVKADGTIEEIQQSVQQIFEQAVYSALVIHTNDESLIKRVLSEQSDKIGIEASETFSNIYYNEDLCDATITKKVIQAIIGYEWTENEKKNVGKTLDEIVFLTVLSEHSVYGKIGQITELSETLLTENGAEWEAFQGATNKQAIYREIAGLDKNAAGRKFNTIEDFVAFLNEKANYVEENDEGSNGSSGGRVGSTTVSLGAGISTTPQLSEINKADKFSDIAHVDWAKEAISYFASKDVLNGRSETEFAPDENMKREELAKVLVLAFELDGNKKADFADVDPKSWYYDYIGCVMENGIMNGYGANFGVGDFITREDLATICYRLSGEKLSAENGSEFADNSEISDYAKEAVLALSKQGIINGFEDNTFRPKAYATRAQSAKIVYETLMLKEVE